MSVHVIGTLRHGQACPQCLRSARTRAVPPVLCGCRPVSIEPADAADNRIEALPSPVGFAIRSFLLTPIDRDIA